MASEDLRLDLLEAVDDAAGAELGRGARPDRAERDRRVEGGDRLGDVRHVRGDAVAFADALFHESRAHAGGLAAQVAPRPLALLAQLGRVLDRQPVVGLVTEGVLCVVQRRAGEPGRAGHLVRAEDLLVRRLGADAEVLPDRGPELLDVVDRPLPQLGVVLGQAALAREARDLCALDAFGGRRPEQLVFGHGGRGRYPKRRSRRAFATTDTLLNAMAHPAITGLSRPAAASGSAATL